MAEEAMHNFSQTHALDPVINHFRKFVADYDKRYRVEEVEDRFLAFKDNLARIHAHNAKNASFLLDLNVHADLTPQAFAAVHVGGLSGMPDVSGLLPVRSTSLRSQGVLPQEVNWVQKGALPPVTNQGSCGACWSFASTATLSAAWQIATGQLEVLSQQQLMDCSVSFGNQGCRGGNMENAFSYARKAALCKASSYQYSGSIGTCRDTDCEAVIPLGGILGYMAVPAYNEQALLAAVAKQPVAVGIEAEQSPAFMLYKRGVMSEACGTQPNHAVVVVGFGTEDSMPYWLVRNSWGASWGEDGYFKLKRGAGPLGEGECGILVMPSYPVVDGTVAAKGVPPAADTPESQSPYGGPSCADGVFSASLRTAGIAGRVCAPECGAWNQCPGEGRCILRKGQKRYCALACKGTSECPVGATCARSGTGLGVCLFALVPTATELTAGNPGIASLEVAIEAIEAIEAVKVVEAVEAGETGRKLSFI